MIPAPPSSGQREEPHVLQQQRETRRGPEGPTTPVSRQRRSSASTAVALTHRPPMRLKRRRAGNRGPAAAELAGYKNKYCEVREAPRACIWSVCVTACRLVWWRSSLPAARSCKVQPCRGFHQLSTHKIGSAIQGIDYPHRGQADSLGGSGTSRAGLGKSGFLTHKMMVLSSVEHMGVIV